MNSCPNCGHPLKIVSDGDLPPPIYPAFYALPTSELKVSVRTANCLRLMNEADGIITIGQLISTSDQWLLRFPMFGPKSLRETKEAIDALRRESALNVQKGE